jgi:hypothetical protein
MEKQQLLYKTLDLEKDEDLNYYKSLEEKLSFYEDTITKGKIVSMGSLLCFLIILSLNICLTSRFSWLYLLIPGLITIIILTIVFNLFLRIEEIIDSLEKKDVNIGTIISYFCVNVVSISITVYLILFCLKMDNIISAQFSIISIPLYILLGVSLFYLIFIIPALIQQGMYFELLVISGYIINTFFFLLMINFKADSSSASFKFSTILVPLWVAISLHFLYIMFSSVVKEESFNKHLFFYIFLAAFLASTVCLCLKNDSNIGIQNWVVCLFSVTALSSYIIEFFLHHILKQDENEMKKH